MENSENDPISFKFIAMFYITSALIAAGLAVFIGNQLGWSKEEDPKEQLLDQKYALMCLDISFSGKVIRVNKRSERQVWYKLELDCPELIIPEGFDMYEHNCHDFGVNTQSKRVRIFVRESGVHKGDIVMKEAGSNTISIYSPDMVLKFSH